MHSKIDHWYQPTLTHLTMFLLPFSWLFSIIVRIRRWCFRVGLLKSTRFDLPVIVVGNLTVGGTGKTPCVIALADFLRSQGYHPGIVSRGVGAKKAASPIVVHANSDVNKVGDEALLMARALLSPVVICADRVAAVDHLRKSFPKCDIVLSDDGLQHYRLARDVEIAVIDGEREFGNGRMIPAGPLREPMSRLIEVDFAIVNGGSVDHVSTKSHVMTMVPVKWVSLINSSITKDVDAWRNQSIHAVAGIGNPKRFFDTLKHLEIDIDENPYPDHYAFRKHDLNFTDTKPVLMTAKDAVKCESFAGEMFWYLDIRAKFDDKFLQSIMSKLAEGQSA